MSRAARLQRKNNRLSDGRTIRALKTPWAGFLQEDMFRLRAKLPLHERPMNIKELDEALQTGAYQSIKDVDRKRWRTNRYGVYKRGFERRQPLPIGDTVFWCGEWSCHSVFDVPDVRHPHNPNIGLRQATGMLDFDLDKLQYERETRWWEAKPIRGVVSVTADFNPETDVRVVDIMRPRGWALVDENGYPLRTQPSHPNIPAARCSSILHHSENWGSNPRVKTYGWHGSIAVSYDHERWRFVIASMGWDWGSAVAVVSREP